MRSRLSVAARGLGAVLLLALLLVGLPAVLIGVIGLPSSVPSGAQLLHRLTTPDDGTVFVAAGATIGWIAWAVFAVSTVVEAAALRRHRAARRLVALAGPQRLAAQLLAAAALLTSSPTGHIGSAAPARPAAVALADRPPVDLRLPAAAPGAERPGAAVTTTAPQPARFPAGAADGVEVEVHRGDTLWDLAERHYGDGEQWRRIARANYGRPQPDGASLADAHWIYPGWRLVVPGVTAGTGHGQGAAPPGSAQRGAGGAGSGSAAPDDGHSSGGQAGSGGDAGAVHGRPRADGGGQGRDRGPAAGEGEDSAPQPSRPTAAPVIPTGPAERSPAAQTPAPGDRPGRSNVPTSPRVPEPDGEGLPAPLLVAFAGGGTLLAGVTLTALLRARRRQFRNRRPGRSIRTPPPELAAAEKAVLEAGRRGAADVTWLNSALRSLARTLAPADVALPDVVAACLTDRAIRLVLARPHRSPPAPWRVDGDGTRWVLERDAPLGFSEADVPFGFAPFPTLVTVGEGAAGEHWLLDLERIAALSLSGSPERCLDLARFLAAELAHNAWSEQLTVTLVGFGAEMAALNPLRLRYTEDLAGAVAGLRHALDRAVEAIADTGAGVLDGRLREDIGDGWAPQVLLIAPSVAAADGAGLRELLEAMRAQPGRTAVALVLADEPDGAVIGTRWQLTVDEAGTLRIPALGLELTAQRLPAEEAADLAALLALAADVDDAPMPRAGGEQPWDAYADAAGAPAPEMTAPRPARLRGVPDVEVTGLRTRHRGWIRCCRCRPPPTCEAAAATEEDVEALARRPWAGAAAGDRGRGPDAGHRPRRHGGTQATRVPKLRVLGPVTLTGCGRPPARRARLLHRAGHLSGHPAARRGPGRDRRRAAPARPEDR